MPRFDSLVIQDQRHLKWRALDPVEQGLMILCGICIATFSFLVFADVITRAIGRPWLWVQEVTMTFFIYGIFIGVAAATRRNDHLYLAVLAESMSGGARVFFEFMQELVQSSIEHISQGISVVDQQMRMVAWNKRYLEFFEYPPDYVRIGRPVADLIRFNLERNGCAPADLDAEVEKRVRYLKLGQPHNFERYRPEGRVLEVSGNPMPGGGFVTSYTDITSHKELEQQLRKANETLEQRVQERTRELEEANFSKSRFLAATSHDLMQPLNAAGLFASALEEKVTDPQLKDLTKGITSSLQAADDLLNRLLEVSRIDSGAIKPKLQTDSLDELLATLSLEFSALAERKSLAFRQVKTSALITSDKQLLRRIVQNFLSNAVRYTPTGKILLG